MGIRPPPMTGSPSGYPARPAHPGLGLPSLPPGLPQPPHLASSSSSGYGGGSGGGMPGFVREVKTTSVFVGGIAPGISDDTLKNLLNVSHAFTFTIYRFSQALTD